MVLRLQRECVKSNGKGETEKGAVWYKTKN